MRHRESELLLLATFRSAAVLCASHRAFTIAEMVPVNALNSFECCLLTMVHTDYAMATVQRRNAEALTEAWLVRGDDWSVGIESVLTCSPCRLQRSQRQSVEGEESSVQLHQLGRGRTVAYMLGTVQQVRWQVVSPKAREPQP